MFNITHMAKPGICKARRCKGDIVSDGLCERHLAEWVAAGKPPFAGTGSAVVATNLLSAGTTESLAEEKVSVEKSLALIEGFQITDQASMDVAGQFLSGVRDAKESLQNRMEEQLGPIRASEESIRAVFGPVANAYQVCEELLRSKINAHVRNQQELQDSARQEVEANGGSVDIHTLTVAHGIENVALPIGMGVRETWGYEVTDETMLRRSVALGEIRARLVELGKDQELAGFTAALQELLGVPTHATSQCLAINHKHLAAVARSLKGEANIPGIKVTQTTSVTAPRRQIAT